MGEFLVIRDFVSCSEDIAVTGRSSLIDRMKNHKTSLDLLKIDRRCRELQQYILPLNSEGEPRAIK